MAEIVERADNGVVVYQVTAEAGLVSNIYCERPYCSKDSRNFLYARQTEAGGPEDRAEWEYVLCEFGTWKRRVVGKGELTASVAYDGRFYYLRRAGAKAKEIVRLDLETGESEVFMTYPGGLDRAGHPTVSPDGRHIAYGIDISYDPQMFGVEIADVRTGERRVICEDRFLCNPHLQFEPAEGRLVLVQHNRGCEYSKEGQRVKLVGEEGATIFLLDVRSGAITRLPVGKPHSTPLTGHEAWVGETQEIIMTVAAQGEFAPEKGNILLVRAGEPFRQIGQGREMNHIGCTPCGRYFHADGVRSQEIILGSPRTGRTALVCVSRTSFRKEFGQMGHPHAYLSPDYRWVVFNSDRTGRPQTYAASIPRELVAGLDGE